jgi:hypothetical protein
MKKLGIVLCLALLPVSGWCAVQLPENKTAEKQTVIVAMTGVHSKSRLSVKKDFFTAAAYTALKEITEISVIPQGIIDALKLNIEENNRQSLEKAAEALKADSLLSFFIEMNNYDYSIACYIIDGKSGEQKFTKKDKAKDSFSAVAIIRSYIAESKNLLLLPGVPKRAEKKAVLEKAVVEKKPVEEELSKEIKSSEIATTLAKSPAAVKSEKQENLQKEKAQGSGKEPVAPKSAPISEVLAEKTAPDGKALKQNSFQAEKDRINLEISLYDFIDKRFKLDELLHDNVFFFAVNYKMLAPSKSLAATFGPFFSQNNGVNDLGLRINGYFYPYPENVMKIFLSLSGAGAVSLANGVVSIAGEAKMGLEISMGPVELFLESGAGLKNNSNSLNLMVNSGIRAYVF